VIRNAFRLRLRRILLAATLLWTAGVAAIALYERLTVDPWAFLGEDRGAIFFRWAPHLDYSRSPFGDFVLVLDAARFWLVLLGPLLALCLLAALAGLLGRRRGDTLREAPHSRS
jgi:hypothetical protein